MVGVSDPVGAGLVTSLARPGGNVTGLTNIAADLSAKLMEIFVEIVPGLSRVGVMFNRDNPGSVSQMQGTQDAVRTLGLQFQVLSARTPREFENAFARFKADGAKGVVCLADSSFIEHRTMIAELAGRMRLPTAFQRRENVEAGGLFSYGPNLNDQFRQVAFYVDRILKGTRPAELPVEQPTKFELVINFKTAKAIGLEIPPTLLTRADEVIE
jgi:putative ABC transport system substrate-binding protein